MVSCLLFHYWSSSGYIISELFLVDETWIGCFWGFRDHLDQNPNIHSLHSFNSAGKCDSCQLIPDILVSLAMNNWHDSLAHLSLDCQVVLAIDGSLLMELLAGSTLEVRYNSNANRIPVGTLSPHESVTLPVELMIHWNFQLSRIQWLELRICFAESFGSLISEPLVYAANGGQAEN